MIRIAITGANGQVGSEIALLLRDVPGIEVVAIARNPSGSAFLRSQGLACRHGRLAEAADAARLLADCDVVAHFALSTTGRARADRRANRAMTRNVVEGAKPGVRLIFFSTIMVYAPNTTLGFIPDSYGIEKLANERLFRRLARRDGRQAFVFRLGHVLGDLQNISQIITQQVNAGDISLPQAGEGGSNTVFTAMIARAIMHVGDGRTPAGTYDLISSPQWSWKKVYAHHAERAGVALTIRASDGPRVAFGLRAAASGIFRRLLTYLSGNQYLRERLTFMLGMLPERTNYRIQARYLQARAFREIGALKTPPTQMAAAAWRALAVKSLPALADAAECVRQFPLRLARDLSLSPVEPPT